MLKITYNKYGTYGVYRGFTTAYYSATLSGYTYFALYKGMKVKLREYFQPKTQAQVSAIYTVSSLLAEAISLVIQYPYEVVKVRMVGTNEKYNYKSIPHAFR